MGYNKSRLVYYCPIKRARTSFGPCGPQELLPLPFHTHNLNHVSAFFYPCLSCLGLASLTLVSAPLHTGCWLINIRDSVFSLSFLIFFLFFAPIVFCFSHQSFLFFSPPWVLSPTFHFCLSLTTLSPSWLASASLLLCLFVFVLIVASVAPVRFWVS